MNKSAKVDLSVLHEFADLTHTPLYCCPLQSALPSCLWVSEKICEMTGFSREDALQPGWWENHLHLDELSDQRKIQASLLAGGEVIQEYRFRCKDGHYVWVRDKSKLIQVDESSRCLLGTWTDIQEAKTAQESALQERGFSAELIETLAGAFYLFDHDGKILRWNSFLERLVGYSPDEIRGMKPLDFVVPEDRKELSRRYEEVFREGAAMVEARLLSKNGKTFWYRLNGRRIMFRGAPCLVGMGLDITDLKAAEQKISERDERFRAMFHQASVGMAQLDLHGRLLLVNDQLCSLLGYEREELIGRSLHEITHPEDLDVDLDQACLLTAGQRSSSSVEKRYITKRGLPVWVNVAVSLVRNAAGSPEYAFAVVRDLSKRKEAEHNLQRSEAHYRSLIETAGALIMGLSTEGVILEWNPEAQRVLGWARSEALGTNFFERFLAPDARKAALEDFAEVLGGKLTRDYETTLQARDGNPRIVVWNVAKLDEGLGGMSAIAVGRDVTERRRMNQEFLRAQRLESLGALASGIAHDLNNILAPILMGAQLIKMNNPDPELARVVDTMEQSAQRGATLVKQVLTFAKGASGQRGPVQLKHLIRDVVSILKATCPKEIEISTNLQGAIWPVLGDSTELHQVLMNLCVNARDAMPTGGILVIRCKNHPATAQRPEVPGKVCVEIADTGTGIPPEIVGKIFDPFFTTKAPGKGTGLGLSTTRRIVEGHGGSIEVETKPGVGTTFRVCLPADTEQVSESENETPAQAPSGHGETILLVDDEAAVREMTKALLETRNYKVLLAEDGADALAQYMRSADRIKLVLLDFRMPVLDGRAAAQAFRKISPALKIIMITGTDLMSPADLLRVIPANGALSKPLIADKLLVEVDRVLNG